MSRRSIDCDYLCTIVSLYVFPTSAGSNKLTLVKPTPQNNNLRMALESIARKLRDGRVADSSIAPLVLVIDDVHAPAAPVVFRQVLHSSIGKIHNKNNGTRCLAC